MSRTHGRTRATGHFDRIAISIGRTSAKPTGPDPLAACTLTK
ncbi:hypothetical protein [Streptomyces sp. NPDC007905]